MNVQVFSSPPEASRAVADLVSDVVRQRPDARLALATGRTPVSLYQEMVRRQREGIVDFRNIHAFLLDEFVGLPPDHPASFRQLMKKTLFDPLGLSAEQIHLPSVGYDETIRNNGGIDLAVVGIGPNGHVAFNEPGSSVESRTRVVELQESSRKMHAESFGSLQSVPRQAMTMGIGTLLESRRLVLLAFGKEKKEIVDRALNGEVTEKIPASLLRGHSDLWVFLDTNWLT